MDLHQIITNIQNEYPENFHETHANILNTLFGFADSMAIKSAVELRIADIIHSYDDKPVTLSQIASKIDAPSPNLTHLLRLMRLLVRKNYFNSSFAHQSAQNEELFGLTSTSKFLMHDHPLSLAPFFLTLTHPSRITPWHEISYWVREGGVPYEKVYGQSFWEVKSKNAEFDKLFNNGMVSMTRVNIKNILMSYREELEKQEGVIVDVGGGNGYLAAAIAQVHPHIKCINFDMPDVVKTAPEYPGVSHVGGDMFKDIPHANAIFMKNVLHSCGDEDCVKILRNCEKAVRGKNGKVIIIEMVIRPKGSGLFDDAKIYYDLEMGIMVGGKERTEQEWSKLFTQANFTRYNIIDMQCDLSIIEAYP